jgi:dTDP-4-dehydrorhamnose 3,5-epimerase
MNIISTEFEGLYVIEPAVFKDNRGYFFETYNKTKFKEVGLEYDFIQDNISLSSFGTIRGLHYQKKEYAQAKLVSVFNGRVLDVVVDIRKNSRTFGKSFAVELSSENHKQLLIPRGLAHGFSVLSETAEFHYKCDNSWNKLSEGGIRFDDPHLAVDWKIQATNIVVSEKDMSLPFWSDIILDECV